MDARETHGGGERGRKATQRGMRAGYMAQGRSGGGRQKSDACRRLENGLCKAKTASGLGLWSATIPSPFRKSSSRSG